MEEELNDASKAKWYTIVFDLKKQFGKKPDMNGILYIIGMRELGQNRVFEKEEKMDLFHIATCKLLSYEGYYELEKTDDEGWPHYKLIKELGNKNLLEQEIFLKKLVIKYFEESGLIS